jgi:hypothetical protein
VSHEYTSEASVRVYETLTCLWACTLAPLAVVIWVELICRIVDKVCLPPSYLSSYGSWSMVVKEEVKDI